MYIGLTLLEVLLLVFGGMGLLDALTHAFGTMATGGHDLHVGQDRGAGGGEAGHGLEKSARVPGNGTESTKGSAPVAATDNQLKATRRYPERTLRVVSFGRRAKSRPAAKISRLTPIGARKVQTSLVSP